MIAVTVALAVASSSGIAFAFSPTHTGLGSKLLILTCSKTMNCLIGSFCGGLR